MNKEQKLLPFPEEPIIPRIQSSDDLYKKYNKIYREFWLVYTYKDEFIPGYRDCCYCSTEEPATTRISVNVWGNIIERDVCDRHKWKDGKRVEN